MTRASRTIRCDDPPRPGRAVASCSDSSGQSIAPLLHYPAQAVVHDAKACYRALASHDPRFDGRFFVGVRTTRIYCRPICRVRLPRAENCEFFASAAAAERRGLRPCLRCRPELAPGWTAVDSTSQLARAAAHLIDSTLASGDALSAVARRIGVSDRHLRRLFDSHFGVAPVDYRQTQRLLLAKRLLTDTDLPVAIVAQAAGFGSLRRLHASMRERYRLTPGDLRGRRVEADSAALSFRLPLRHPYAWRAMSDFLCSRAINGLETGTPDGGYARVVSLAAPRAGPAGRSSGARIHGWLAARVTGHEPVFELTLAPALAPVLAQILPLSRSLFDLDLDPHPVAHALGALAVAQPGLRMPGAIDGFEIAVRAVLGQQISVKAARTLLARFVHAFGEPCSFAAQPALQRAFPTPETIAAADAQTIGLLGIIRRRVATIQALAKEIAAGRLVLDAGAPLAATMASLRALPGIGDWTAQYVAMRALRWPDAFPAADHGVMKALGVTKPAQALAIAEPWRPWRAYAVMHLWAGLETASADPS